MLIYDLVFWIAKKQVLVASLIVLDLFLVLDIKTNLRDPNSKVLGTQTSVKKKFYISKKPPVINSLYVAKRYPSLTPSKKPTPTPALTPTPSPKPDENKDSETSFLGSFNTSVQMSSQSNSVVILGNSLIDQINQFRSSNGKSPISENSETCSFASTRANEIVSSFNHDGFSSRVSSKTLPYTSYSQVAENIAMNGDVSKVVPGWISSPGHAENMLKEVQFGCVRNSGNYYVLELWKP